MSQLRRQLCTPSDSACEAPCEASFLANPGSEEGRVRFNLSAGSRAVFWEARRTACYRALRGRTVSPIGGSTVRFLIFLVLLGAVAPGCEEPTSPPIGVPALSEQDGIAHVFSAGPSCPLRGGCQSNGRNGARGIGQCARTDVGSGPSRDSQGIVRHAQGSVPQVTGLTYLVPHAARVVVCREEPRTAAGTSSDLPAVGRWAPPSSLSGVQPA